MINPVREFEGFPTQFSSDVVNMVGVRTHVHTDSGCPIVDIYSPVFDKHGAMELEVSGVKNLYEEIQSHKDSVDIHVLLKRYANGESDVLNKVTGRYFDATAMPKTYAEALNAMNEAHRNFDSLPVEIRDKFGHSFERYLASAGSSEWFDNLGIKSQVEVVKEEGVVNES